MTLTFAAQLGSVCKEYQDRIFLLEADKWDLERSCKIKLLEVNGRLDDTIELGHDQLLKGWPCDTWSVLAT